MHANANSAMETTCSAKCPVGIEIRWSSISFKSMSCTVAIIGDSEVEGTNEVEGVKIDEIESPGCFPMMISNARTPKLYISHFSLNFMVNASSARQKGIWVSIDGYYEQKLYRYR